MLRVGDKAPDFALPNQDGDIVHLSHFRGKKVIVFAFPKANTYGCNNQACNFRDEFPQIDSSNAVVLGMSTDSTETLKGWKQGKKLPYDLLSDADHQVLEAWGAWGIKLGIIALPAATRSYWVIDEDGIIIDMEIGIGPKASVEKAIAAIQNSSTQETQNA